MPANFDLSYYDYENNQLFCISKRIWKALDQRRRTLPANEKPRSDCCESLRGFHMGISLFFGALFCQHSNYEQIVNFEILKGFFILFLYHNIIGTTINSTKEEPICLKSSLRQRN